MKRTIAGIAVLGLLVGACGSGDDDAQSDSAGASTETTGGDETPPSDDSAAGQTTEGGSSDDSTSGESAGGSDDTGSGDTGDVVDAETIRSLSDIPQVCLDQMADFLREIEPVVSSIDWRSATLADFENIAEDFQSIADDFEASSEINGCNDLDFVDENESEILQEFASDEAPGTVGFLEFLAVLGSSVDDGSGESGSAGGAAFESCADGIAFVQNLMDTYDSFADVPATELMKFSQISTLYLTCTPEELEFFDSGELDAFLAG